MQNAQLLNLEPVTSRHDSYAESTPTEDGFHSDDLIEQTRSDVRRVRLMVDQQQEEQRRRTRTFTMILGTLTLLFLVTLWLLYPTLRNQKTAAAEMVGLKN